MGLFSKKIIITNNRGTVIALGNENQINASQRLSDIKETEIKIDNKEWDTILNLLHKMQDEIRNIPDEFEVIRDEELTPLISQLKREAKENKENPSKQKKPFIEKVKSLIEISSKVTEVATTLTPFLVKILSVFGIII